MARQADALLELAVGQAQAQGQGQATASTRTSSSSRPSALAGSFGSGWQGLAELLRHAAVAQAELNALLGGHQLRALNALLGLGKQVEVTKGSLKGGFTG